VKGPALAACLLVFACVRSAHGQPAIEDVRVVYRAPQGCPAEAQVVRRIRARTDRFRPATSESARLFSISITESGGRYSGTLEITEPGPTPRTTWRRIEAPNCIEVADGLALIAALTIDPRAKVEAPDEPEAEEPATREEVVSPAPVEKPREEITPLPPPATREPPHKGYFGYGAGFAGASGVAPVVMYGAQAFIEGALPSRSAWFGPAARLTLRHLRHEGVSFPEAEGVAHIRLTTLALDFCPIRTAGRPFELRLCGTFEGGSLEAEGTGTDVPEQHSRGWLAPGGVVRVSVVLGRIGLELGGGFLAPLRRDSFVFDSNQVSHQVGEVENVVLFAGLAITGRI
jgi:hypothetical protein